LWLKAIVDAWLIFLSEQKKELKERAANADAEFLQSKYDFCGGTEELDRSSVTSISVLLCTAAKNLHMPDCDISQHKRKLKEDWFKLSGAVDEQES
jgi:hypothetical protein